MQGFFALVAVISACRGPFAGQHGRLAEKRSLLVRQRQKVKALSPS